MCVHDVRGRQVRSEHPASGQPSLFTSAHACAADSLDAAR